MVPTDGKEVATVLYFNVYISRVEITVLTGIKVHKDNNQMHF